MGNRVDRLEWLIDTLQNALGWQVEIEQQQIGGYEVVLKFEVRLKNKIWPEFGRKYEVRRAIYELVKYRLDRIWEQEFRKVGKE